jgi:hypothetical protein
MLNEITLSELKQILTDNNLEFFVKKQKDNIVKIHFMVKDEDDDQVHI